MRVSFESEKFDICFRYMLVNIDLIMGLQVIGLVTRRHFVLGLGVVKL